MFADDMINGKENDETEKKQPLAGLRSSLHILARGQTLFDLTQQ